MQKYLLPNKYMLKLKHTIMPNTKKRSYFRRHMRSEIYEEIRKIKGAIHRTTIYNSYIRT